MLQPIFVSPYCITAAAISQTYALTIDLNNGQFESAMDKLSVSVVEKST
jgi:hypothetical protein